MIRIGFIIEQALGHITHTKNLQANVPDDPSIEAHWGPIPFDVSGPAKHLPLFNSNWTIRAGLRANGVLRQLTRATTLDALFFHTQVPAVLNKRWIRSYPTVISLDATPRQYDTLGASYAHQASPAAIEKFKWRLNRDCYRSARHLVTWSAWAKQGLIDEYEVPSDKITVIPPGVNVAEWQRPLEAAARTEIVRILFVGGDLGRKGGNDLMAVWRRLVARYEPSGPTVELHLVTRAPVPPEPGLFVYNDLQPNSRELKQLYFKCDLFCLPTYGDCLPMVLSEAGAAGLPVISTRVAAIPEITLDGETGLIVPTGDLAALETALHSLVTNREMRLAMSAKAVAVVGQQFDARRNAARLLDLLKLVASGA